MQHQVAGHRGAGHVEDHRLESAGPHHGLDAAEADEDDADQREERYGIAELPAHDHRHRQRRRVQPHAGGEQPRDEEKGRARVLRLRAETVLEKLVDGGAVELVEGRDEEEGDQHAGRRRADEELQVLPVLGVTDGRYAHDGHGADLGSHKGQSPYPDRRLAVAEEIVLGVLFPPPLHEGDDEQGEDGGPEYAVIQRGQPGYLL
ncbi:MAG: hypothetical protein A2X31_11310 [Elusimicrobia bacterium GWB2_63_22]|nr:MAG: hypothetical protein A2X31_11310 [Elusimicrobia bacterium GWB2_63_22]